MQILAKLGVPSDRLNWLAARIPYRGPPQARQVA